jgi:hypothetical protein
MYGVKNRRKTVSSMVRALEECLISDRDPEQRAVSALKWFMQHPDVKQIREYHITEQWGWDGISVF